LPTILNAKLLPFLALSKTQRLKQEKERVFLKLTKPISKPQYFTTKRILKGKRKKKS
jgi:hypothetical protein